MDIRWDRTTPVVKVAGELDVGGRDLLEAVLSHVRSPRRGPVAVDPADVSFVDTHGLSPVLERDVVLVAASPAVSRVLRLLGVSLPRRLAGAARGRRRRSDIVPD